MRRHLSLTAATTFAALLIVGGAISARAQTTKTETKTFTVISVDGNQVVARLPEGTREITVPDDFRFTVNGEPTSVHDLKPGMTGTAVITTTTTVKPVTVTEVKNATVENVSGNSILVKSEDGFKQFTESDVEKRNIKIMREGKEAHISDFHRGDRLTATIVTEKPPQILTERQVQATIAHAPEPAPSASAPAPHMPPVPAVRHETSAAPAPAAKELPKTASSSPLLALIGLLSLSVGAGLTMARRRRLV